MKVLNKLRNRKGVTLIELIIVIAILGIVIGAAYSFFFYGINVFAKGGIKSEIQQDLNQAAFYMTNRVRNVKKISLTSQPGYSSLNIQSKHPNINSIEYVITHVGGTYNLEFLITREGHTVESKILLNNVKTATTGSGSNIWYQASSPIPPVAANAQLSTLAVSNGTLSPTFNSSISSYTVSLPYGTATAPTVSATGKDGATANITQAGSPNGTATVNVTSADGSATNSYTVTFAVSTTPPSGPTLTSILNGFTFTINNATSGNPTITINQPSDMGGATVNKAGSTTTQGSRSASIAVSGNTGTITRPSSGGDLNCTITLTAIRSGEPNTTRVITVSIPRGTSAVTITNSGLL
jgi:prepilin-type N-terminal cleavage/methylation domain-containing protein